MCVHVRALCVSRQTQWDPPSWDSGSDDASVGHEAEMDLGTPTYDENPSKVNPFPSKAALRTPDPAE